MARGCGWTIRIISLVWFNRHREMEAPRVLGTIKVVRANSNKMDSDFVGIHKRHQGHPIQNNVFCTPSLIYGYATSTLSSRVGCVYIVFIITFRESLLYISSGNTPRTFYYQSPPPSLSISLCVSLSISHCLRSLSLSVSRSGN